jgi:metallo-beta-lactamase family protein
MIDFLGCQDAGMIDKTYLVHGEYETQVNYSAELQKAGFKNIAIPSKGQEYTF